MGIFTRLRDIISSNVNAMLDRAEDPEKLIRLMIQEMEDTLVEIKADCAGAMAAAAKVERELAACEQAAEDWQAKAELALDRGREDLAREALAEKRRMRSRAEDLGREASEAQALVGRYQEDIMALEQKLASVREKQRLLVQRHLQARHKRRARQEVRRADSAEAMMRFDKFESRVERMEAEAEMVDFGRADLGRRFESLTGDEELERELSELKASRQARG